MNLFNRAIARAFSQIGVSPGLHAMSALALALTCFLAGSFGLFLANLDHYLLSRTENAQFQIYWKPGANQAQVKEQWEAIRRMEGVAELQCFSPDQALESLKKALGDGLDLSWMKGSNPLPPTALASFRVTSEDSGPARAFLDYLKALPGVDKVRLSPLQLDWATALRALSVKALVPLSVSLSLIIAVMAYLTSRLCLEGRRLEVEIMRLVGAREWFVRLPWAVSAAVTGLSGVLLGLAGLHGAQIFAADALYSPPLWIKLGPLPLEEAAAMALLTLIMSALGGWLAARE